MFRGEEQRAGEAVVEGRNSDEHFVAARPDVEMVGREEEWVMDW